MAAVVDVAGHRLRPLGKPVLALGWAGGKRIIMHVAKTDRRARLRPVGGGCDRAPQHLFCDEANLVEEGSFAEMAPEMSRTDGLVTATDLGFKVNAAQRTAAGWRGRSAHPGVALKH